MLGPNFILFKISLSGCTLYNLSPSKEDPGLQMLASSHPSSWYHAQHSTAQPLTLIWLGYTPVCQPGTQCILLFLSNSSQSQEIGSCLCFTNHKNNKNKHRNSPPEEYAHWSQVPLYTSLAHRLECSTPSTQHCHTACNIPPVTNSEFVLSFLTSPAPSWFLPIMATSFVRLFIQSC